MPLTVLSQFQTLRAAIDADPTLSARPNTQGDNQVIADAFNAVAAPDFWAWRTSVPTAEYRGNNGILWTEVDSLTVGKARIFEWLTTGLSLAINMADPNVRAGIDNAFGTNSTTRANLYVMGRRLTTRAEKLFATGTGSTASPATLTFEGKINYTDVFNARGL